MREELREQFEALPGVRFAVKDGSNLLVLADGEDALPGVSAQIEQILGQYQILELRFPMGFAVDTQEVGEQALEILRAQERPRGNRYANITSAQYGEDLDAFLTTLVEMRDFLGSYASKVRIAPGPGVNLAVGERIVLEGETELAEELIVEVTGVFGDLGEGMIIQGSPVQSMDRVAYKGFRLLGEGERGEFIGDVEIENERYRLAYAVDESLRLLAELEELAVQASAAVDNAEAVLVTFQEALMQLEVLQVQMRQLNEGITQGDAKPSGEQFLITLLLNGLFPDPGPERAQQRRAVPGFPTEPGYRGDAPEPGRDQHSDCQCPGDRRGRDHGADRFCPGIHCPISAMRKSASPFG